MTSRIENRVGIRAPAERIWEIIAELDAWREWNPVFVEARGAISIGGELSLVEQIEDRPPREVQARIVDWVPNTQLIWAERRGFLSRSMRYIEIEELQPGSCIVANGEMFAGFLGEGYGDKHRPVLRRACEALGHALRQRAEG